MGLMGPTRTWSIFQVGWNLAFQLSRLDETYHGQLYRFYGTVPGQLYRLNGTYLVSFVG